MLRRGHDRYLRPLAVFQVNVELLQLLADFLRPPVPQHLGADDFAVDGKVVARLSPLAALDAIDVGVIQTGIGSGSRCRHWV